MRARIIELDKAGNEDAARALGWELQRELFGARYDALVGAVGGSRWRAGYLVDLQLTASALKRAALLDEVLALPCAQLVRGVRMDVDRPDELAAVCHRLARGATATSVRQLALNAFWKPAAQPATFEPGWLAPLAVRRLHLFGRAIALPFGPELARLRSLWITPGAPQNLRDLFEHVFPELAELVVYVGTLEHRHGQRAELFAPVLDGTTAPALRELHLRGASEPYRQVLDEQVKASPFASKLGEFAFGFG